MPDVLLERLDKIEAALNQGDRPLSFTEGAAYLNCSLSYLYKLTHRRLIPYFKPLGKKIFFRRQDLEAFLLQNPVKTREQLKREITDRPGARQQGRENQTAINK